MRAMLAARASAADAWCGRQRLQARKPAASAAAQSAWKATFSGRARRDGQEGRQYTPVVLTEYTKRPSCMASRASTAAQRGSRWVLMSCSFMAEL